MCEYKFHCMWCDHKMICVGLLKQDPRSGDEMTARIVPDALKKLRMCIFLFFFFFGKFSFNFYHFINNTHRLKKFFKNIISE